MKFRYLTDIDVIEITRCGWSRCSRDCLSRLKPQIPGSAVNAAMAASQPIDSFREELGVPPGGRREGRELPRES